MYLRVTEGTDLNISEVHKINNIINELFKIYLNIHNIDMLTILCQFVCALYINCKMTLETK